MKIPNHLYHISWAIIPVSILIGDMWTRWDGGLPPNVYNSPENFVTSVILSWSLWWAFSRAISTTKHPWLISFLITLPFSLTISVLWSYQNVLSHDIEPDIILYFYNNIGNSLSLGWSAVGLPIITLIILTSSIWTVSLAKTPPAKPEKKRLYRLTCTGFVIIWLIVSLYWPPATPALGSPYISDINASNLIASTVRSAKSNRSQDLLNTASRPQIPPQTIANMPNVILFIGESLRADNMSVLGYEHPTTPFLSNLSQRAPDQTFWFDHAYATSPSTVTSLATILNGTYSFADRDEFHRMPLLWHYAAAAGAKTALFTPQDWGWQGLNNFFIIHDPPHTVRTAPQFYAPTINDTGVDDRLVIDAARTWLDQQTQSPDPFFGVIQFNATHFPGLPHPNPPWPTDNPTGKYDATILLMDELIGQIVETLEKNNQLENTIILFTADHAEFIIDPSSNKKPSVPGSRVLSCAPEIMKIPFMLYVPKSLLADPQIKNALHQNQTRTISHLDILPTLLQAATIKPLQDYAGKSILEPIPKDRVAFCSSSPGWPGMNTIGLAAANTQQSIFMRSDFIEPFVFHRTHQNNGIQWTNSDELTPQLLTWFESAIREDPLVFKYARQISHHHPNWNPFTE